MPTLKKSSSDFMISSGSMLKGFESIKEMKKRVELDLIYQREWNLILDLKIILKTILKFKSTNSY